MAPPYRSLDVMKSQLREALDWLGSLDVPLHSQSRFPQLSEALDLVREGAQAYLEDPEGRRETYLNAILAHQEVSDLIRIHRAFADRDPDELRHRVQRAVKGPAWLGDETAKNSDGRNFTAELSWAAVLQHSGYPAVLTGDADVVVDAPAGATSVGLSFEVKRLSSAGQLESAVRKGSKQVAKAVRGACDTAGIDVVAGAVVLVLDRLLDVSPELLDRPSEQEAQRLLKEPIFRFIREHREALEAGRGQLGVQGVVLWWRPLAFLARGDGDAGVMTDCNQPWLWPYGDPDDWRFQFIDGLWRKAKFPALQLERGG